MGYYPIHLPQVRDYIASADFKQQWDELKQQVRQRRPAFIWEQGLNPYGQKGPMRWGCTPPAKREGSDIPLAKWQGRTEAHRFPPPSQNQPLKPADRPRPRHRHQRRGGVLPASGEPPSLAHALLCSAGRRRRGGRLGTQTQPLSVFCSPSAVPAHHQQSTAQRLPTPKHPGPPGRRAAALAAPPPQQHAARGDLLARGRGDGRRQPGCAQGGVWAAGGM
jgi:hypothetical protein